MRTAKTLIRLGADSLSWFCHDAAHITEMHIKTEHRVNVIQTETYQLNTT